MESILSPELLGSTEYGNNSDQLVLPANTTHQQRQKLAQKRLREGAPTEDVKEVVKKLSKKKQKRVDQIQKRKEREVKQSEYFQTIKDNELSLQARQLITSSKALNHTMSVKQTLSFLMKKEKAGLHLSEDEMGLLYVQKPVVGDQPHPDMDKYMMESQPILHGKGKQTISSSEDQDSISLPVEAVVVETPAEALLSFGDLFATSKSTFSNNGKPKDKMKKNKNNSPVTAMNLEAEVEVLQPEVELSSVPIVVDKKTKKEQTAARKKMGSNLLSQLMNIKGGKIEMPNTSKDAVVDDTSSMDVVVESYLQAAAPSSTYQIEETVMPVSDLGKIQSSKSGSGEAVAILRTKRVTEICRPAKVVSDRMNLPVCRMEQEIVEAINSNDVIVLCGETGSGKSTQVCIHLGCYQIWYGFD
jgi:hypothetical protein